MPVALAFTSAFVISGLAGWALLPWLGRVGARQTVSEDAPARHSAKQGTPTMGGLFILAGFVVAGGLGATRHAGAAAALGMSLVFALVGFVDDLLIARRGKNQGVTARQKLAGQFAAAALFTWWVYCRHQPHATVVAGLDLGAAYWVLALLLISGMSNAINLTDGLDGLAGGVSAIIAISLAAAGASVAPVAGLSAALAGGCCGFLLWNAYPARCFMGNTGSTFIGAALAAMAILVHRELFLLVAALVPLVEVASVVIQVSVFKHRKRKYGIEYARTNRVFKRTPIHHGLEETGWSETEIVQRFWLATALAAGAALSLTEVLGGF